MCDYVTDTDRLLAELLAETKKGNALLEKIDQELEPLRPLLKKIAKAKHLPAPLVRNAIEKGLQQ